MGTIQYIRSARKEWKCSKCGSIISKGDSYYKGEISFGPTIVACAKCKLKSYEVTASEYILRVGRLCEEYSTDYTMDRDGVSMMISELESIRDECQEKLDNMPEGLQDGSAAQLIQERIDNCDDAISELENIDFETIICDVIDEYVSDSDIFDVNDNIEYNDIMSSAKVPYSDKKDIIARIKEDTEYAIYDAISNMEY